MYNVYHVCVTLSNHNVVMAWNSLGAKLVPYGLSLTGVVVEADFPHWCCLLYSVQPWTCSLPQWKRSFYLSLEELYPQRLPRLGGVLPGLR